MANRVLKSVVCLALITVQACTEAKRTDTVSTQPAGASDCEVEVWEDAGFEANWNHPEVIRGDGLGRKIYFEPRYYFQGFPLHTREINDNISSFKMLSGTARLCVDTEAEGYGKCIGPYAAGQSVEDLAPLDVNDEISWIDCDPFGQ